MQYGVIYQLIKSKQKNNKRKLSFRRHFQILIMLTIGILLSRVLLSITKDMGIAPLVCIFDMFKKGKYKR